MCKLALHIHANFHVRRLHRTHCYGLVHIITRSAQPDWQLPSAGFAFVKMIGALGGFLGPSLIGLMADAHNDYAASMAVLSCCLLLAGALCLGFTEPGDPFLAFRV